MTKKKNLKKIKIWIINQFANTPDMPGGTRHYELAEYFAKQNLEVDVFSSDFNLSTRNYSKLRNFQFFKTEKIKKIKWNWLRVYPYKKNNWKRYVNLMSFCVNLLIWQLLNVLRNSLPNIVIASSPQLIAAYQSLIFAKLFRIKFIFEVRDIWPQILIELGGSNPKSLLLRILKLMEVELYKYSDAVVILSKGARNYVESNGAKKVIWLPNGPNLKDFHFSSLPVEPKTFNSRRPFRIIYAGAHGLANDLNNVIEAAEILRDAPIEIVLIGDGPEKNKLVFKAKGLKNVIFKSPISKSKIPIIMKDSDAILISLKDVQIFKYGISPNKLYDAYALGRPVISTVGGFVNQEIENNYIGLTTEPGKPERLAKIIKRMYKLPRVERETMGIMGRKLAENIYSREKIRKSFLDLIKSFK